MRRRYFLVYDDIVEAGDARTTRELDPILGTFDQIAIHAIVDDIDVAGGTLTVNLFHTADGINYVRKNPAADDVTVPQTGTLSTTVTNQGWGADGGQNPFLGMVRLQIDFNGATSRGHVKIYVTQRDQG